MIRDSNSWLSLWRTNHCHLHSPYPQCSFRLRRNMRRKDGEGRRVWRWKDAKCDSLFFLLAPSDYIFRNYFLYHKSCVPFNFYFNRVIFAWIQAHCKLHWCHVNRSGWTGKPCIIQMLHYSNMVTSTVSPVFTAQIKHMRCFYCVIHL